MRGRLMMLFTVSTVRTLCSTSNRIMVFASITAAPWTLEGNLNVAKPLAHVALPRFFEKWVNPDARVTYRNIVW